ncbi:glycosyltransferase [Altericista sp. CCNU0014]|uniref:glycosyltransferase n=1 Tax=Altericista sp. CCNU0014 TaxID=3082949 RepID=UPI00384B5D35
MSKQIHFVTFDAGGGHRTVVEALTVEISRQYPSWTVRTLNISKTIFDPIDPFYRLTGRQGEGFFYNNLIIAKGWTWIYPLTMFLARLRIWGLYPIARKRLQQYWLDRQPDIVVSTIPLYNKLLWDSLKSVNPNTPFVTLLSDLADTPPHHYIEPSIDQFAMCPTAEAVRQAEDIGVAPEKIFRTSGMSLLPKFYDSTLLDIPAERQRLGLDPDRLTGLVFFGSQGSDVMLAIARSLERLHRDVQLIFLCGHHQKVVASLRHASTQLVRHVEGFTKDVPYFMKLSDFFIGKPGANSVSEAVAMHLPVIVECNRHAVAHELANADWIRQYQLGIAIESFRNIDKAVEGMLDPTLFKKLQSNTVAMENRAVIEIPEMLQQILECQNLDSAHYQAREECLM